MIGNCVTNCVSTTVTFIPDYRSTFDRKAEARGADELLNDAGWALRDDRATLAKFTLFYRFFCRSLARAMERVREGGQR
jgi:hypothetical protein